MLHPCYGQEAIDDLRSEIRSMRTNAPGNFSCEIYLKSWELGFREGTTKLHIDSCYFCNPIVHGGTEDFPLSVEEQAKLNIADRKRKSRRLFFRHTATAAGIVGLTALGFNQFRDTESVVPTSSVDAEIANDFTRYDSRYATLGRPKIESILANHPTTQKVRVLEWIQVRGHSGMYDLICRSLANRDLRVSMAAYVFLRRIAPAALKGHLHIVEWAIPQIKSQDFLNVVLNLAAEIESS